MTSEERRWLNHATRYGGDFVQSFAKTCFYADDSNFELLKPVLLELMNKYPKYSAMEVEQL